MCRAHMLKSSDIVDNNRHVKPIDNEANIDTLLRATLNIMTFCVREKNYMYPHTCLLKSMQQSNIVWTIIVIIWINTNSWNIVKK